MFHLCKRIEHQTISHYYKSLDVGFPLGFVNVIYNKDGNCIAQIFSIVFWHSVHLEVRFYLYSFSMFNFQVSLSVISSLKRLIINKMIYI